MDTIQLQRDLKLVLKKGYELLFLSCAVSMALVEAFIINSSEIFSFDYFKLIIRKVLESICNNFIFESI